MIICSCLHFLNNEYLFIYLLTILFCNFPSGIIYPFLIGSFFLLICENSLHIQKPNLCHLYYTSFSSVFWCLYYFVYNIFKKSYQIFKNLYLAKYDSLFFNGFGVLCLALKILPHFNIIKIFTYIFI